MSNDTGTIAGYGKERSEAKHGDLEQEILGRTDDGIIGQTAAARIENNMMRQRNRVCVAEGLIVVGRLHTERLEHVAERRDRLFIRSRTAICHGSGRGAIDR